MGGGVEPEEDGGYEVGLAVECGRRNAGRGWGWVSQEVLTCHQVPNEKGLVLLVVLQHALEVLLFPLDGDLSVELVAPLLTLG